MDPNTGTLTTQHLPFALLLLLLLYLISASTSSNSTTDQLSLLHFKSSITSDPHRILDSWTPKTSFCNWTGIVCDLAHQRVEAIRLPGLSLSGNLSPHLANLSFLRDLDLQNNSLQGQLPTEFGNLSQLRNLLLSLNPLSGSIPPSLSSCSELRQLDLSDNLFQGLIPQELGRLQQLQILILARCHLTGPIPSSFGNLSSLTNLILMDNKLNGSIPAELGRLKRLRNVQLSSNLLTGDIPTSLFNLSSLLEFKVTDNRLTGRLPLDLFLKMPKLEVLLVAVNELSGPIPSSLSNASVLLDVDFSENRFSGQIPLLHNLPRIENLTFEFNQLVSDGPGGLDFIASLSNSPRLKIFQLGNNRLTGQLPPSIANLSLALETLDMEGNRLEGSLPVEIGNFVKLTHFSVRYNRISGGIPPTIGNLRKLARLRLQGNSFNGSIPESLGNLTGLYELSLNDNQLTGSIPSSLANCRRLQTLELSSNKLVGPIPGEIFDLPSLSMTLNLSHNSLSGPLPTEIGSLQAVKTIDVSNNRLSGRIPATIGNCRGLEYLDMAANSFEGSIPSAIGDLRGSQRIDLSSNNLSGAIPSSLESLRAVKLLNLSMNKLQGEVPGGGVFQNSTVILLAGNSELCGRPSLGLPTCTENRRSRPARLIIGLVVGALAFCLLCSALLVFCKRGWRKSADAPIVDEISFEGSHSLYTYYDLRTATDNFSPRNLLGEGSYGTVYRGTLRDGSVIAVKVFKLDICDAYKSFSRECESIRGIRHRNLVKIISACSGTAFKALVFQFMPNGSLEDWLHKAEDNSHRKKEKSLDLTQRLEIAVGIADAMEYLHHDCEIPIVHCDLKPSNVLLDEDLNAHVGDFGLAKMVVRDAATNQQVASTMELKGSIGYIPPEYGMQGGVSSKGDVYSYGILLLELLTRKKSTDEMFVEGLTLRKWVAAALPHRVREVLDPEIADYNQLQAEDCLISVLRLGLQCSVDLPGERPTMRYTSAIIKAARDELR